MKKIGFFLTLLLVTLIFAGCNNSEELPPYFNNPTIESQYGFQIRYFWRGWQPDEDLVESTHDFYAEEREFLDEFPEFLEHNWGGRRRPEPGSHFAVEIRIVSSVNELLPPSLTEYTGHFFENNYLVVIDLTMPGGLLSELVHRIEEDGTIQFRPLMINAPNPAAISYWTVIIELDNRFQPPWFSVEFISNPWFS